MSKIEWTDETWNCVTGCTRHSEGCDHCYAASMTKRLHAMGHEKYQGLYGNGHFNGVVKCWNDQLSKPLSWKKPRRVFVNSMSDTFHKDVPFEFIDEIMAVAAQCPQHMFQILTKRATRMREYFCTLEYHGQLPLPNVWLGVSAENQKYADERIPHLLNTPAAIRFISAEPLLSEMDLSKFIYPESDQHGNYRPDLCIVGGESGHGSRPCAVEWIRSVVKQCREAGVDCFVKQLGTRVFDRTAEDVATVYPQSMWWPDSVCKKHKRGMEFVPLSHSKGGDPEEWPMDLRVREMPA